MSQSTALYQRIETSFLRQGLMQHLGARIVRVQPGEVEFALPLSDKVTQQQGAFHGGALGALADICCGYAALSVAPEGMEVTTVEYKINFVAAALGTEVFCVGKVVKAGRTLTITSAELFDVKDGQRKLCGVMQATLIAVAKKY
ncbi:MAG: PaaI family thioesterase [Burkholderiales bacterium]|mgnify:CR=1 FL=1